MKTLKILALLCFIIPAGFAAGFSPGNSFKSAKSDSAYKEFLNLRYDNSTETSNLIDIFLPPGHNISTRMLVFVHGGFWSRGSKNQLPKALVNVLTSKGYAVSAFNYHLVKDDGNKFPVQMEDMKKALAFLSSKGDSLGYNGNEFALLGASAGAHMVLLYAFAHDPQKQIKTIIDLFGPTDLTDTMVRGHNVLANTTISRFLGETDPDAQIAKDASPMYHLTKESGVPTLIIHGEADDIVDVSQSVRLNRKLNELGIKSRLITYPGEKHELRKKMFDVFMNISKWLEEEYAAQ